jgi:hypothetical protein
MKSTKNLLITGLVLATALFTSVQVSAMSTAEELMAEGTVNAKLTRNQKRSIIQKIENIKMKLNACDPKRASQKTLEVCNELKQQLQAIKNMYFDNRPYTDDECYALLER